MKRVLITGMSGTGKSSVIQELAARGFKAVDTDWDPSWEFDAGSEWLWREDRIAELLAAEDSDVLFVSACVSNQGKFYDRFDQIVLLTASEEVTLARLAARTNNPYGKAQSQVADVLGYKETVEPLLRKGATAEIDTGIPLQEVVSRVLSITSVSPAMLELDLQLSSAAALALCAQHGVVVRSEGQLAGIPGSHHWHLHRPGRPGTVELSEAEGRVWVKVHPLRDGGWARDFAREVASIRQDVGSQ
jgi:NAD(P)-dependent dehydrogenase (short-subunit alcohol dehydrogenase family)